MWSEFAKLKWWTPKWGKRSYHSWLATPQLSLTYTWSCSSLRLHHVKWAPLKPMSLNLQSSSTSRKFAIFHPLLGSTPYFSFAESILLKSPMHIHGNVTCWWSRCIKFHASIRFNFSGCPLIPVNLHETPSFSITITSVWLFDKVFNFTSHSESHNKAKPPPIPVLSTHTTLSIFNLSLTSSMPFFLSLVSIRNTIRGCWTLMSSESSPTALFSPSPHQLRLNILIVQLP